MAPTVASTAVKIATCCPRPGLWPSCSTAWSCGPCTWIPCPDIGSSRASRLVPRESGLLTADVVLQLLDREILVGDDVAHDFADRDHAHHAALVHHGQVADVLLRHELHALPRLGARAHHHHVRRHDLLDARGVRGAALEDHLAGVVALREDAGEAIAGHDDRGADVLRGEHLDRLEHAL